MGDRANIVVKTANEQVCLYAHWRGGELPLILRLALINGTSRWSDFSYLTRIIFCEMVKNEVSGTTGYGISQAVGDGSDKILWVDIDKQTVTVNEGAPVSFERYVVDGTGWLS